MKKLWFFITLAVIFGGYTAWAAKARLTTNGVDWGTNYYDPDACSGDQYDKLPAEANPAWIAAYNTGSYVLSNSFLRITTASSKSGGEGTRQSFSMKDGWDLTTDTIVEATLRVVENIDGLPASGAQQICYGNGAIRSYVAFTVDSIRTSTGASYKHDMTQWTTVRLVFENMYDSKKAAVKVYINNGANPVLINKTWYPGSAELNCLRFGDMNVTSGGTVDWESIRWKCEGAAAKTAAAVKVNETYTSRSKRAAEGWGVILNEDGDFSATDPDPEISAQYIRTMLGKLVDTPVKTVMHSVGAGSDILYYPSKFGSYWGWRELPKYEGNAAWAPRIIAGRNAGKSGADLIMVAADVVNGMGMRFVPSVRMNDAHFVFDPLNSPLTGKFWMENQDKTIVDSPIASKNEYGNALNFLRKEVRDYRLGIIKEVIERYGEKMDGLELDFNRFQVFFPKGKSEEGMPLMTELVREVRAQLDAKSAKTGRCYTLFVRVPPAVRNCLWAGLDIETWAKEGLVGVVIPSQMMTVAHDMPVREFVNILSPYGVKVIPTIYERTQYNAPMSAAVPDTINGRDFDRLATPAQIAGIIINQRAQGADGFQLYNFDVPFRANDLRMADCINDPGLIEERAYLVTAGYYLDHEDNYQYRKQIPLAIKQGQENAVTMMIGEDLAAADIAAATSRILRLGFSKPLTRKAGLRFAVNGSVIHDGAIGKALVSVTGARRDAAAAYVYFSLDEKVPFRKGENTLTFSVSEGVDFGDLVEVQLHVAPLKAKGYPSRDYLFQSRTTDRLPAAGPDFGLIWNTDGDVSFTDPDPERSMEYLRQAIDSLTNGSVRTLALSVGSGSDVLNYPTKIAQTWGWRQTPSDNDPRWKNRVQGGRAATERGVDAVRAAGEQAKKSGLLFVPSYRVADSHYCSAPETHPLTGRFWLEHSNDCTIGLSPTEKYPAYQHQLNFALEDVRAYRLRIIDEVLDRYADLMDGFQLDFMRTPVFFRPGEEQQKAPLLTEMLRQTRKHLDKAGQARGVYLPLLVRIPASIALCRNVGIDIETWIREGLVDVIMPAQMMSVAQEMPLTEFVNLTGGTRCRVYASLCSRTSDWTWFYRDTIPGTPRRNPLRLAEPALFRAAVANYQAMGVDHFEMYNFALPMRDDGIEISRRFIRPLPGDDRLYTVTQDEGWYEDFCQYPKDLPGELTSGQPVTCRLLVGEDIATLVPQPKHVGIRLGFNGLTPGAQIRVRLNGQTVFEGAANDALRTAAKPVYGFFHIPVPDRRLLRKGDNLIETTLLDQKSGKVTLVEAVLAVLF